MCLSLGYINYSGAHATNSISQRAKRGSRMVIINSVTSGVSIISIIIVIISLGCPFVMATSKSVSEYLFIVYLQEE